MTATKVKWRIIGVQAGDADAVCERTNTGTTNPWRLR